MKHGPYAPVNQGGVALVTALILLLIMTVLGLVMLRVTLLEERMSANLYARSLSFQATEAALREAESLLIVSPPPIFTSGCANGLCTMPVATEVDRWDNNTNFTSWRPATAGLKTLQGTPEFFIEDMGKHPAWPGCDQEVPIQSTCLRPRYRITARSGSGPADVLLQSNYMTP
ncbi:PilX N-terminal domain-containing pilus assembly protein [Lysobacter sp. LF1]|uniref:PilX N-terminal domain-containing pilus assembly protein n=1 Tax=Lysobacter stagni TaxID=3045172 RepID=A0ABT6XIA6_9GAMM|nr:PilX N-terminal domain-containing pilus assembly protein [Lysobacter sp. LF1]MDI9239895.1 PilX N-terminal domain-containing pilus assembly protein [Lysobacter sp. LF1]